MSSNGPPSRKIKSDYDLRDDIIAEQERKNLELEEEFVTATKQLREELQFYMEQANSLQRNMYARILELEHQLQMKRSAMRHSGVASRKKRALEKAKK